MLPADPKELRRTLTRMVQSGKVWANAAFSGSAAEDQINTPLELDESSDPKQLVRELAARWRESIMPHAMNARYKREWNLFLCLEVGFFFPLRRGGPIPANIGQIGVLLSDREHIALVIADGDQRKAASYLTPSYEEFWRSIVPDDEALPYTTVNARIDRAVRLLSTAVHGEPGFVRQIETVPSELPSTRPTQSPLPFVQNSALSQYLEYGLPDEPKFVPEE